MELSQHIQYLLYYHNCVIIPDFGGIITNNVHAKVSPKKDRILPPAKSLAFNRNLTNNDGLLVNRIVNTEAITYEQASHRVKEAVSSWKKKLQQKQAITIPAIGRFKFDIENNLQFEPSPDQNYLRSSFGLPEIRCNPLIRKPAAVEATTKEPTILVTGDKKAATKKRRKVNVYVVIIVILLALSIYQYFNLKNNSGSSNISQFGFVDSIFNWDLPFGADNSETTFLEEPAVNTKTADPIVDHHLEEPAPENTVPIDMPENEAEPAVTETAETETAEIAAAETDVAEPKADIITPTPETATPALTENPWYVIVGAFRDQTNANQLKNRLNAEGYAHVDVMENANGYLRVGIGFESRKEARSDLYTIRNTVNSGAWILEH